MGKSIIAIDLGSNSLRVLKVDSKTKDVIDGFRKTVKTADNLANTGKISNDALSRVVIALNEAKEKLDFSDTIVKAVTTEAIRQASNGDEVLAKIKEQTGVDFEVIDGVAEAEYALSATQNRLKLLGKSPKNFMLVDIGGGSTEMLFHYGEDKTFSKSFPIGIVTVTQRFNGLAEIADGIPILMNPMRNYYNEVVSKYGEVELFVATAGTPTTVASMKLGMEYANYDAQKIHGTILTQKDLIEQLNKLIHMKYKERVKVVGLGRDDLIASGILIYDELYIISGFKESMVIDDGVCEGVAYSMCNT
ncbi:Possible phosphatase [hydrothermal vent metagenome]|uniref:Possible phosphatase n=1 Tax=hydrothermal vent metagenome TaxID=652676 RepID=A0A1W1C416_9ZZZZ